MESYIRCLCLMAILACFASAASAIKCYHCDSDLDPKCFDLSGNFGYIECTNDNYNVNVTELGCMKVEINNEHTKIIRECYYGTKSFMKYGCHLERPYAKCHKCEWDLCNSSTITVPIVTAVTFCFIMVRLMS